MQVTTIPFGLGLASSYRSTPWTMIWDTDAPPTPVLVMEFLTELDQIWLGEQGGEQGIFLQRPFQVPQAVDLTMAFDASQADSRLFAGPDWPLPPAASDLSMALDASEQPDRMFLTPDFAANYTASNLAMALDASEQPDRFFTYEGFSASASNLSMAFDASEQPDRIFLPPGAV